MSLKSDQTDFIRDLTLNRALHTVFAPAVLAAVKILVS